MVVSYPTDHRFYLLRIFSCYLKQHCNRNGNHKHTTTSLAFPFWSAVRSLRIQFRLCALAANDSESNPNLLKQRKKKNFEQIIIRKRFRKKKEKKCRSYKKEKKKDHQYLYLCAEYLFIFSISATFPVFDLCRPVSKFILRRPVWSLIGDEDKQSEKKQTGGILWLHRPAQDKCRAGKSESTFPLALSALLLSAAVFRIINDWQHLECIMSFI